VEEEEMMTMDTMEGGTDTMEGGEMSDTMEGGTDTMEGGEISDTMEGGDMTDTMEGGEMSDTMEGGEMSDTMEGGDMTDTMEGGEMSDTMEGGEMSDTMEGGEMTDTMEGGEMTDTMEGGEMSDTMEGGEMSDTMEGGDMTDTMEGGDMMDDEPAEPEAIIGVSSGEFDDPEDPEEDAVFEIVGANGGTDNRFEWGEAVEDSFASLLQFDGADFFGAKPQEEFKIGQIFYRNGTIESGTGFNGEFGFSIDLDIEGLEEDPAPFDFFFDILNTPNDSGDPVEDADRLRFVTSGLSPQTFEFDGNTYTLELLGFSQDGGDSFEDGFDSPEEGFDIASLYGKLIQVSSGDDDDDDDDDDDGNGGGGGSDPTGSLFVSLETNIFISLQAAGAEFIGGDSDGEGAIAGSTFLSKTQLNTFWSRRTSTTLAFINDDLNQLPEGEVDLDDVEDGGEVAVGSDGDDDISGTEDGDAIVSGDGDDHVNGEGGNDHMLGQEGDDSVEGSEGNDLMNGNQGNDMVMGGDGDDITRGGQGNDMVMGGEGNDNLFGDYGDDILMGGGGNDNFVLRTQTDVNLQAALSLDFIADFEFGVDRIGLDSEVSLTYEVGDFNGDGVNDVGIQLEAGFLIGAVLNTEDMDAVKESVDTVPEGDFLLGAS
jgi:Ca2+-binding RTX toxin-like protein